MRTTVGGGYGRYLVLNNHSEWVGGIGLAHSHENYLGGEIVDSVEGVITTAFKVYGSCDSKPPLADSRQSDYGVTTSLGYSF